MDCDRWSLAERAMAKMVAEKVVQKTLDKLESTLIAFFYQDLAKYAKEKIDKSINHCRYYRVEVYPDGTCDLIHESAYEPEEDEEDTLTFEEDEERVYHLKLKCANCGHSWDQEIPFGMDFFPFSLGDTHWEAGYGHPKANTGHRSSVGKELIQCPKCGSHKAEREVIPWFTAKQREVKP